ncbi:VOC family protein [Actinomadura sp. 1N219]|uniref:VOC family protein n=1 Tax=Actinomadura sp. 1N219 TaxID=3375152 RepID=UPI0037A1F9E2
MQGLPKWFGHVNLNVRGLARAETFYREVIGLAPVWRMASDADQSGAAFEVSGQVRFNGVLLGDDRGVRGPVLDVLEWTPAVTDDDGPAPRTGHRWGLDTLLISTPDPGALAERVHRDGGTTTWVDSPRTLVLRDPDGTNLEVTQDGESTRFRGVRIFCSSLQRSQAFYQRVLQMRPTDEGTVTVEGRVHDSCVMRFDGSRDTFGIELCQPPADTLLAPAVRPGNHPGLYRMALVTDDVQASLDLLAEVLPVPPRVARVELGTEVGYLDAAFFEDPDGAVVEFVEHGVVRASQRNTAETAKDA